MSSEEAECHRATVCKEVLEGLPGLRASLALTHASKYVDERSMHKGGMSPAR